MARASRLLSKVAPLLLALLALLVRAAPARAEAAKTVVMVVDSSALPIARRLGLEIESLGLTVQVLDASSPQAAFAKDQALAAGAVAAIHLAPLGGGDVDMTILDRATGHTVNWRVAAPTPEDPAPLDLIATRTVELLRASLLELAARRAAEAEAAERARKAREAAREAARESEPRFSLSAAPALSYSAHLRPSLLLQTGLAWLPVKHFGLAFSALLPALGSRLESQQGTVDVFASLYRLAPVFQTGEAASPVSLRCASGLELDWVRFEGSALSPYRGSKESRTAWAPFVAATTRFRLARSVYVFSELAAAVAFPATVVRVAGAEVTTWGRPLGTAAIGVELTWPTGAAE